MATDPEARKDAAEARLPEVWEPEFLRTFAREAARRGVEIKLPPATLDKLADGIDVLVSELEAAQKAIEAAIAMRERISRTDGKEWDFGRWNECAAFDDALAAVSGVAAPTEKEER